MADLLGIGTSGLLAFQQALTTTSHNISNANTEGYSRQTVGFQTRVPEYIGVGYLGTGVTTSDISRNFDNFLAEQVLNQTSNSERYTAFHTLASQIDNLLADPEAGLTPVMEEFFSATQAVADNPNSIPARQVMLSSAESLADRFHYIDQRLRDLNTRANKQLEVTVDEINSFAKNIAQLNLEISRARGMSGGKDPNDLLDQRDLLIKQLSALVDVKTLEQNDGQMNVFIGSGQGLVIGTSTVTLDVRADSLIPSKMKVVIDDGLAGIDVSKLLTGGRIGGTLDFSNNVLEESRNALGRIAVGLSEQVNDIHQLGLDLTGTLGADFFSPATAFVQPNGANTATGLPTVGYADASAITVNDYLLEFSAGTWNLSNYRTGQAIPWTTGSGTAIDPYIVDGLSIDLSSIVGGAAGDQFLIRPTSEGASYFNVAVNDPSRVAAAGALLGQEVTDANGLPLNTGSGVVKDVSPADNSSLPLGGAITLTYDAVLQQFTVAGAAPAVLPYNPATDDGSTQTLTVGTMNISFTLTGVPQAGDQFVIDNNTNAVSDNRNALALGNLQTDKTLINGTATYQTAYGQMVAKVGTQTHQAEVNMRATGTLLEQAESAFQQVSGVNLDEEAANLIKYQQAYQATAQVITTANTLFQTLLEAF